jgi:hypothetical protein
VTARTPARVLSLALVLAACGPARAPESHDNFTDGRGAHAGAFRAPGNDRDPAAAAGNTQSTKR